MMLFGGRSTQRYVILAYIELVSTEPMNNYVYQGDTYYVHFFTPSPYQRDNHGRAIPLSRFNQLFDMPNPSLIMWHHTQAVRMRIRGFSIGMHKRPQGGKRARRLSEH
jgi:hypothetical protein